MSTIQITVLSSGNLQDIKPLLADGFRVPYRFLKNTPGIDLENYLFDEIKEAMQDINTRVWVGIYEDKIVGALVFADLPWETRIFKKKMGTIKYFLINNGFHQKTELADKLLDHLIKWASTSNLEFLQYKAYTNDSLMIHLLESGGFLLMDTVLDYVYDQNRFPFESIPKPQSRDDVNLRLSKQEDEGELIEIAQRSFGNHFGRFHADESILPGQATRVYEEWITSSLKGYADYLIVAEINAEIAGYSIWKKPSSNELRHGLGIGHFSICGIHPGYQGKGLFGLLTWDGMRLLSDQVEWMEGPTHVNNYPVQRGYAKLSWQIQDARHTFHKWLQR
ncbi:MAG: hypothetical protein ABIJ65_08255 [Chloroflexota bacterium]